MSVPCVLCPPNSPPPPPLLSLLGPVRVYVYYIYIYILDNCFITRNDLSSIRGKLGGQSYPPPPTPSSTSSTTHQYATASLKIYVQILDVLERNEIIWTKDRGIARGMGLIVVRNKTTGCNSI